MTIQNGLTGMNGYQYSSGFRYGNEALNPRQNKAELALGAAAEKEAATKVAAENTVENQSQEALKEVSEAEKASKVADPKDFVFDFKKNHSFQLVAATSEAEDMDVKKAISDMKKDDVLDQYKYFVGNANLGTDADGTVRVKKM